MFHLFKEIFIKKVTLLTGFLITAANIQTIKMVQSNLMNAGHFNCLYL